MAFDVGEIRAFLRLDDTQFNRAVEQVPGKARAAGTAVAGAMDTAQTATSGAARTVEQLASTLDKGTGAVTANTRAWLANQIGSDKLKQLEQMGVNTRQYIDAVAGVPGAQAAMRKSLEGNEAALRDLDTQIGLVTHAQDDLRTRTRAAGDSIEQASVKVEDSTKKMGAAGKAFAAVGGLIAGAGIVSYISSSINAASDLNETMSKSGQIFGSAAGEVAKWGESAAKNVGLSKAAAVGAAANFGNLFTQIGFTADAAAELSTKTVQMSADLGSFNNQPTAEVADKISAAFRGEYDSLQAMIPTINAAKVETQALADTGKTNADQLTAQEKAQAVLTIINRDGAKAMGDYARTADGYANSTKTLSARLEEQKATLGEKLLPVATTVMQLFGDVGVPVLSAFGDVLGVVASFAKPVIEALGWIIKGFGDLPGPVQVAIVGLAATAALAGPLSHLGDGLTGLAAKAKGAGAALKAAFISNPVGIAITALATAFAIFGAGSNDAEDAQADLKEQIDKTTAALDQQTGAATDANRALIRERLGSRLDDYEKLGLTTKRVTDAMLGNADAAREVREAILDSARATVEASNYYTSSKASFDKVGVSLDDLTSAALNQDWGPVTKKFQEYNDTLKAGEAPITGVQGMLDGLGRSTEGVRQNYNDLNGETQLFVDAQGRLQLKAKDAGESLDDLGGKAGDTKTATDDVKGSTDKYIQKLGDIGPAVDDAIADLDRLQGKTSELDAMNRQGEAAIRDYAASIRDSDAAVRDVARAEADLAEVRGDSKSTAADIKDAEDKVADAHDRVADAATGSTEKGEELRRKMLELSIAAGAEALAQGDTAGAYEKAKGKADEYVGALQATLTKTLGSEQAAKDYIARLGLIPDDVATTVVASTEGARSVLDKYKEQLDKLDGATANTTIRAILNITQGPSQLMRFDASTGRLVPQAAGGVLVGGRVLHAAAGMIRTSEMMRGGADVVRSAEPSIPWETYISGDPGVAGRSNAIMGWTAGRLGGKYTPPGVDLPGVTGSAGSDSGIMDRLDKLIEAVGRIPGGKNQIGENVVVQQGDIDELLYKLTKRVQNR